MFNKEYTIKGKHAVYIRYLIGSSEGLTVSKSAKIFDYGYQVLFVAPLLGLAYDLRSKVDESESTNFTVPIKQIINNKGKLDKAYRMVLLADKSIKLNADEKVDFVFRPDENEKEKAEEVFNSYLLGGIEWLYSEIARDGGTTDDYLNNMISAIGEFTIEFAIYRDDELEDRIREVEGMYY